MSDIRKAEFCGCETIFDFEVAGKDAFALLDQAAEMEVRMKKFLPGLRNLKRFVEAAELSGVSKDEKTETWHTAAMRCDNILHNLFDKVSTAHAISRSLF